MKTHNNWVFENHTLFPFCFFLHSKHESAANTELFPSSSSILLNSPNHGPSERSSFSVQEAVDDARGEKSSPHHPCRRWRPGSLLHHPGPHSPHQHLETTAGDPRQWAAGCGPWRCKPQHLQPKTRPKSKATPPTWTLCQ